MGDHRHYFNNPGDNLDADAAVARVESLGGSVVRAPEDTPYGRLATVADPAGAQFKLVAPKAATPARSGG